MFGNIGLPELIIIFVIILLLFGGKKLPEVGQNLGKAIKSFKDGIAGGNQEAEKKAEAEPAARELPREADAAPALPEAGKEKAKDPARKG